MLKQLRCILICNFLFLIYFGNLFAQAKYISYEEALSSNSKDTIQYIEIRKGKLEVFPIELIDFKNLKGLDISKNRLKDIPEAISQLSNLEELNLSRNKFEHVPLSVTKINSLKKLNMSWNRLTIICNQMENLENLEEIDFYNNEIWDFGTGIEKISSLKALDIRGVMYGIETHKEITKKFAHLKIKIDPPCACME